MANLAVAFEGSAFPVCGELPLDVTEGLAPVYSPEHICHFVINLGSYSGRLTLGCGDGGVYDNSDDVYRITLWKVSPNEQAEY